MELRNYIYIDEKAVNGLYNQIHDNVNSLTASQTKDRKHDVSVHAEVKGVPFVGGGGDYNFDHNTVTTVEKTITIAVEQKVNRLIEYVGKNECEPVGVFIKRNSPFESCIFVGKSYFVLTNLFDNVAKQSIASERVIDSYDAYQRLSFAFVTGDINHLSLTSHHRFTHAEMDDRTYNEFYLDSGNTDFIAEMHLGGDNIRLSVRHLTFAIEHGKGFRFKVFGEIVALGGNYYSIKPFAIWR